jgi:hypothetical protein
MVVVGAKLLKQVILDEERGRASLKVAVLDGQAGTLRIFYSFEFHWSDDKIQEGATRRLL